MARTIFSNGAVAILCSSLLASCAGGGTTATATGGALPAAGAQHGRTAASGFSKPLGTTGCNTNGTGAFVGGTDSNAAGGTNAAVLGGYVNEACGPESGIGTGQGNTVGIAENAFMGGGFANNIADTGQDSFLGAGDGNLVGGGFAAMGGGYLNTLNGQYGTIGGGQGNKVPGSWGSVGGGYGNQAAEIATVPGGKNNVASGEGSFAAGVGSTAGYAGDFVWSDFASSATALKGTAANQFLARASGGVTFYSSPTLTSGVKLAAGSGTWASLSDRNVKTDIVALDDSTVLDKVSNLPISEWSYVSEHGVRHVGPMAQDFYAAFNVGEDDRHITSIDEDGVALAAIKALHRQVLALRSNLAARDVSVATMQRNEVANAARLRAVSAQLDALKAQVAALSRR